MSTFRRGADLVTGAGWQRAVAGAGPPGLGNTGLSQEISHWHIDPAVQSAAAPCADAMQVPPPEPLLQVPDALFVAYLEECLLSDFAVVASSTSSHQLVPRSEILDWDALLRVLHGLGFRPDHEDAWSRLGAVPTKSTKEQITAVARRLEFARTLFSLADHSAWFDDDLEKVETATRRLEAAADEILRELASLGGRRGQGPPGHRLCQELGRIGLEFILSLRNANTVVGTQCSTHLEVPSALRTQALDPTEAAALWIGLCSSSSDAHWSRMAGKEVVIWSPAGADEFGRLLGGFVRHLGQGAPSTTLRLVCPIDDLPGCSSPTAVLQHWAHPGLGERWAGVLSKVEFVMQPIEQVSPGGRYPQVVWRSVGLLSFQRGAVLALPTTLTIEAPRQHARVGRAICLDFPNTAEPEVLKELAAFTAAGWALAEPRRSPASHKLAPRLRMTLCSGDANCSTMDAAVFAQRIHELLRPHGGVAARTDIFLDDTALIMQATGSDVFAMAGELCLELLPLGPKMAVLRTRRDERTWEEAMRLWQSTDPRRSVFQLRHKRLIQDGSLWAGVPGTAQRQRQIASGTEDISSRLLLQLRGPQGPRSEQVVDAIQDMVGTALGGTIRTVQPGAALEAYTLRPERGTVAGALTGRMELALRSPAEARHLHELLHGRGLQLGVDMLAIEVQLTPLARVPGNGRRC